MTLVENEIVGNFYELVKFSSKWHEVRIHPTTYYRHLDEIKDTLKLLMDCYVMFDTEQAVILKFSAEIDRVNFKIAHSAYL